MLWCIFGVLRASVGFASNDGDAAVRVVPRQVRRKVEVEELVVKRTAIRGVGGRSGAHYEEFERADPFKGELGLQYGCFGAFLGALSNGSSNAVDPRPAVGGERRRSAKGVQDGCVAAD